MNTNQSARIPYDAWACFAAGLTAGGLTVFVYLSALDRITWLSFGTWSGLAFLTLVVTVALGLLTLRTIRRSEGRLRGGLLIGWGIALGVIGQCGGLLVLPACTLTY